MRRSNFKDNVNDNVKDKKDTTDKEKDQDNDKSNDLSISDTKANDLKNKDKDNTIINITSDEKNESKWDTIDWSKKGAEEKKESKFDTIDWSKKGSEEGKESKFDMIDWSKKRSEEGKESKWDTIDWSKKRSEEGKESKFDTIDWSKSKNEKTEENKYEHMKDKIMNGEEFKEDFEDLNENKVQKDFLQETNEESKDKDFVEGIEDKLEEQDINKDFVEGIEDKLEEQDINKDFVEGIEDKLESTDINMDFVEGIEDKSQVNDFNDDLHKEIIGNYSEIKVLGDLYDNGKNIYIPYGNNQRYDLISEENGNINRIQVKTGTLNKDGSISFTPYRISKGKYGSYEGEIDSFGIYCKETNKSYVIPIKDLNQENSFSRYNLTQEKQEEYKITPKIERNEESITDLKKEKTMELVKEGKIVLNQLGKVHGQTIIYDNNSKNNDGGTSHNICKQKILANGDMINEELQNPKKIEISRTNIAADLMGNGYIVSQSFKENSDYDYIIEKKYGSDLKHEFYKVKIVEGEVVNDKIRIKIDSNTIKQSVDYYGMFDHKTNRSYLISTDKMNTSIKATETIHVKPDKNLYNVMQAKDKGEAIEMKIAGEFANKGYNVYHPTVGEARYDLVVEKNGKFNTIQVKAGRTYQEKSSTYVRFEASSQKSDKTRNSYKGDVDFIATVNTNTLNSYIVSTNDLPFTDAKLKLDERIDMRQIHQGTIIAKDHDFGKVDDIIKNYNEDKQESAIINEKNHDLLNKSPEDLSILENRQVVDVLRGNTKLNDVIETNSKLKNHVSEFNNINPKDKVGYQGFISVKFRDYLIDQKDLKAQIDDIMKKNGLSQRIENKDQAVYDFIDNFYKKHGRGPNTKELYQNFLNFKSHQLRGKLNIVRSRHPHYYS